MVVLCDRSLLSAAGGNLVKVKWHKNTPESQPESGRDIWIFDTESMLVTCFYDPFDLFDWNDCSHWAYAELPEPPEQDDE